MGSRPAAEFVAELTEARATLAKVSASLDKGDLTAERNLADLERGVARAMAELLRGDARRGTAWPPGRGRAA
jgi:hypothetical protein